ncbi:MAG: hypothetical protein JW797_19745 [Bradymonadales bacterium]|nr:hypothetical protein [Bradymonadales bacterium]
MTTAERDPAVLDGPPRAPAWKVQIARTSLMALAATFELTSRHVPAMQEEIADWEDGRRVGIGVLPLGPFITIAKEGNRLKYLGKGLRNAGVSILFKNLDSALLIFTGQLGAPQAVAENRVCVHGNNYHAMQVTRAMAIVQTYLFPGLILNKTFKRPPRLNVRQLGTKALVMGMLTPRLIANAFVK